MLQTNLKEITKKFKDIFRDVNGMFEISTVENLKKISGKFERNLKTFWKKFREDLKKISKKIEGNLREIWRKFQRNWKWITI